MSTVAHDIDRPTQRRSLGPGLALAVVSATSFGLSGAVGKAMLESGWSAAATVTARVLVAALVLLPAALLALRGHRHLLRRNVPAVLLFGTVAVAGCQLSYFNAVAHLQVGVALLIEYTAPVVVIAWLWLRRGQRPGRLTVLGTVIAGVGLVLVLDLVSGADLSGVGVLWALGATAGVSVYFVMSGDVDDALPPVVLACGGLLVGGVVLLVLGAVGVLPLQVAAESVTYRGTSTPWWLSILLLGVVTAALAYVTGIAAARRLGSRLASVVGLTEVLAALVFAWLLLAELPRPIQIAGGVLILAGVTAVRMGEEPAEASRS